MNTISLKTQSTTLAPASPPRRILRPVGNTQPIIHKSKARSNESVVKTVRKAILILATFMIFQLVLSSLMSDSIYTISSLKSEVLAANIDAQVVEEELANMGSLSFIESEAKSMGMVKGQEFKWISLKENPKGD